MSMNNPVRMRSRLGIDELAQDLVNVTERVVVAEEVLGISPGGGGGGGSGLSERMDAIESDNALLRQ